jgi:hypothetical protein
MANSTVEPKCPACGIVGVDHIEHQESAGQSRGGDPWFEIAYCDGCGHVYGVFAKITHGPTPILPKMPTS